MNLYFGDAISIKTTVLLVIFLVFLGGIVKKRAEVRHWGRFVLGICLVGLSICILGATRDGLHFTVQQAIDGSVEPGLFPLVSAQTIVGAALGIVIVISAILCLFLKKQRAREALFFIIAGSILLKIVMIEASRIMLVLASANLFL
ncbi:MULTISPECIES: hypothetical protein [Enterococcus]|uniref:Uncharacterized protein n=1 Tax=Candidatus Enterococcus murrayae TaxID=2815321 RepID=A0ABS3HMU7_9ENTE|nr:hypothetical protein [Enterococcus sp. MJM16]MBO0454200.1 hypothetical protein [Enterococcus sp. MJM16]